MMYILLKTVPTGYELVSKFETESECHALATTLNIKSYRVELQDDTFNTIVFETVG